MPDVLRRLAALFGCFFGLFLLGSLKNSPRQRSKFSLASIPSLYSALIFLFYASTTQCKGDSRMDNPHGDAEQTNANADVNAITSIASPASDNGDKLGKDGEGTTRPNDKPPSKSWWQLWKDASFAEQLMAFFTFIIAAATVVQVCILNSGSAQTDKLISAANIQACAATRNAESAAKSAQAALDLSRETKSIADRALTQANATNALAIQSKRATDISDATLEEQRRPWIAFDSFIISDKVEVGSKIRNILSYRNWGNGPALRVRNLYQMHQFCGTSQSIHLINVAQRPPVPLC